MMRKRLWTVMLHLRSRRGVLGQDLIEYALLAGFVAVAAAAAIPYSVTTPIANIFSKVYTHLSAWTGS